MLLHADWIEYGLRRRGDPDWVPGQEAGVLGHSREFRERLPGLPIARFNPSDHQLGMGTGSESHWADWPKSFAGALWLRCVDAAPREPWFVIGYAQPVRESEPGGRYATSVLWYVISTEWIRCSDLDEIRESCALLGAILRMLIREPGVHHRVPGGQNEQQRLEILDEDRTLASVEVDAAFDELVAIARSGDRFSMPPRLAPFRPDAYFIKLLAAAMVGNGASKKFAAWARGGVAVLCDTWGKPDFRWQVPFDVPVAVLSRGSASAPPPSAAPKSKSARRDASLAPGYMAALKPGAMVTSSRTSTIPDDATPEADGHRHLDTTVPSPPARAIHSVPGNPLLATEAMRRRYRTLLALAVIHSLLIVGLLVLGFRLWQKVESLENPPPAPVPPPAGSGRQN